MSTPSRQDGVGVFLPVGRPDGDLRPAFFHFVEAVNPTVSSLHTLQKPAAPGPRSTVQPRLQGKKLQVEVPRQRPAALAGSLTVPGEVTAAAARPGHAELLPCPVHRLPGPGCRARYLSPPSLGRPGLGRGGAEELQLSRAWPSGLRRQGGQGLGNHAHRRRPSFYHVRKMGRGRLSRPSTCKTVMTPPLGPCSLTAVAASVVCAGTA